jgi:hypothetical protein
MPKRTSLIEFLRKKAMAPRPPIKPKEDPKDTRKC